MVRAEYNIVDLRPGTYAVTFSLAGFNTFRREGIELTAGFTATVNADMQVGALEETVTVSGASPLVDTQNVRQQTGGLRTSCSTRCRAAPKASWASPGSIPGMIGAARSGGAPGHLRGEQRPCGHAPREGRRQDDLRRHADEQPGDRRVNQLHHQSGHCGGNDGGNGRRLRRERRQRAC